MKRLLLVLLSLALIAILSGCAQKDPYDDIPNPIATITMRDGQVMRFELMIHVAPKTVANFALLANDGFYDGMEFTRVVRGVLIQSGDPVGDGTGNSGAVIKGEFAANGFENTLSHVRGTLSMARRDDDYDSASSQFFIMQGNYPEYDGQYAAFGVAMDEQTLDVIDTIGWQSIDGHYVPLQRQVISTIRVETHGLEFISPATEIES